MKLVINSTEILFYDLKLTIHIIFHTFGINFISVLFKRRPGKTMLFVEFQGIGYYAGLWTIQSNSTEFSADAIGAKFTFSIIAKLDLST